MFHERLGGGLLVSRLFSGRKSRLVPGRRWAVSGCFRKSWVVSGWVVFFQKVPCGFRLGGGLRKDWVVSGKAVWFQEVPCGFRKDPVVSGEAVWFHEGVCPI